MNIQFQQTPNYTPGNTKKLAVVLHFTLGAYNGAVSWLMNANRPNRSSSNFIIGRNPGEIIQLVKLTDIAWHAGNISNPDDRAKRIMLKNLDGSYVNPNQYTIGIELAAGYDVDQAFILILVIGPRDDHVVGGAAGESARGAGRGVLPGVGDTRP